MNVCVWFLPVCVQVTHRANMQVTHRANVQVTHRANTSNAQSKCANVQVTHRAYILSYLGWLEF